MARGMELSGTEMEWEKVGNSVGESGESVGESGNNEGESGSNE